MAARLSHSKICGSAPLPIFGSWMRRVARKPCATATGSASRRTMCRVGDENCPLRPRVAEAMSGLAPGANGWFLIVLGAGVLYDILACLALQHWLRGSVPKCGDPLEPITFFRPLKRGVPGLRE